MLDRNVIRLKYTLTYQLYTRVLDTMLAVVLQKAQDLLEVVTWWEIHPPYIQTFTARSNARQPHVVPMFSVTNAHSRTQNHYTQPREDIQPRINVPMLPQKLGLAYKKA